MVVGPAGEQPDYLSGGTVGVGQRQVNIAVGQRRRSLGKIGRRQAAPVAVPEAVVPGQVPPQIVYAALAHHLPGPLGPGPAPGQPGLSVDSPHHTQQRQRHQGPKGPEIPGGLRRLFSLAHVRFHSFLAWVFCIVDLIQAYKNHTGTGPIRQPFSPVSPLDHWESPWRARDFLPGQKWAARCSPGGPLVSYRKFFPNS